jgi:hypothetical protein
VGAIQCVPSEFTLGPGLIRVTVTCQNSSTTAVGDGATFKEYIGPTVDTLGTTLLLFLRQVGLHFASDHRPNRRRQLPGMRNRINQKSKTILNHPPTVPSMLVHYGQLKSYIAFNHFDRWPEKIDGTTEKLSRLLVPSRIISFYGY